MLSFYSDERNTVKVWNKRTMNVVRRMLLKAYILYDQTAEDAPHHSRLQFTQHVVKQQAASTKQRHTYITSTLLYWTKQNYFMYLFFIFAALPF